MLTPLIIWLSFTVFVLFFCLAKPGAARIFLGFFFIAMALGVNAVTIIVAPGPYAELGADSFFPFYSWFFLNFVAKNPVIYVLPIIVFEIAIGLLLLGKRKYVKIGLLTGMVFLFAITPLSLLTLPNVILGIALATLLRKDYGRTFFDIIRGKKRPPSSTPSARRATCCARPSSSVC